MVFATATAAPRPKTKNIATISLLLACIFVVMAVGQLFSFEKFIPLLEDYQLPGGYGTAVLTAGGLVTAEVFALPFLLRMELSPLMRITSMVCGWLVAAIWLFLVFWANVAPNSLMNIGLFGASVKLPVGWWAVLVVAALSILAGWATWGMWPLRQVVKSAPKSLKK